MKQHELDHRSLDRILADVEFLVEKRLFPKAAGLFAELAAVLEHHMNEEERVDPAAQRPVIRAQHDALAVSLARLREAIAAEDYSNFCAGLGPFVKQLAEHQATEERIHAADS